MEILTAKNRHQQYEQQKELARQNNEQAVGQHREILKQMREERKEAMQAAQEASLAALREQVRQQKEVAARSASEISYLRNVEHEIANFKRNAIRQVLSIIEPNLAHASMKCAFVLFVRVKLWPENVS